MSHLRESTHWGQIESDSREIPHYLLHGWTEPWDPNTTEVWTAHASVPVWAALYSWSGQFPVDYGPRVIELHECPEILGYIYLLKVSNQTFYSQGCRIVRYECEG